MIKVKDPSVCVFSQGCRGVFSCLVDALGFKDFYDTIVGLFGMFDKYRLGRVFTHLFSCCVLSFPILGITWFLGFFGVFYTLVATQIL